MPLGNALLVGLARWRARLHLKGVWHVLGAAVDFFHALAMTAWVLGLPLLFYRRWPRLTRAYAIFAVSFVVLSQGSELILGECFLTTIARTCYQRSPTAIASYEWFTVRFAESIFSMSPSHRSIVYLGEGLIVVTAVGVLLWLHAHRQAKRPA